MMRISRRSAAPTVAPKAAGVAHPIDAHKGLVVKLRALRQVRESQTQRGRSGVGQDHVIGPEEVCPARVEGLRRNRIVSTPDDRTPVPQL